MSNERDRPSLSLPAAQTAVNVLEAFGWRASRQDPLTVSREGADRPAAGDSGQWRRRQAGRPAFRGQRFRAAGTGREVARATSSTSRLPADPVAAADGRRADAVCRAAGRRLCSSRKTGAAPGPKPGWPARDGVSWSNHLQSESNEIRLAWQKQVEKGDPPTTRLTADWRERAEDVVWTLSTRPEFVWMP